MKNRKWFISVLFTMVLAVSASRGPKRSGKQHPKRSPNSVSVKNGKISGFEYLKTLKGKNNRIEETGSSSEDAIFNGQISIIQSFLFQSPFANGVFNDQLLDESSLFYVKALIEAISILTALLTPVLKSMGIDNFSILILGFSPGSIRINFELQIPSEDMSLSGNPGNIAILENLQAHITENNDFAVSLGSGANLALLDSSITSITGGDGDILTSNCPTCWKVSGGLCVPDENYIQINCSQANKIILKADNCVFENLDLSEMSLNGGCNADSGNIYENSGEIRALPTRGYPHVGWAPPTQFRLKVPLPTWVSSWD